MYVALYCMYIIIKYCVFSIGVCDKPVWYSNLSSVTHDQTTQTAILRCTFKACYDPKDDLIKSDWIMNSQKLDLSNKRYSVSHNNANDSHYIYTLTIHHTNINDSGNYCCHIWYKKSMIDPFVAEKGIMYLNVSSNHFYSNTSA